MEAFSYGDDGEFFETDAKESAAPRLKGCAAPPAKLPPRSQR